MTDQLEEAIAEAFNHHLNDDKLYFTEDGNVFLEAHRSAGLHHAHKEGLELYEINRDEFDGAGIGMSEKLEEEEIEEIEVDYENEPTPETRGKRIPKPKVDNAIKEAGAESAKKETKTTKNKQS